MENITTEMLCFREQARHLWNSAFLEAADPMSNVVQNAFTRIERELLRVMVLDQFGLSTFAESYRIDCIRPIFVQPKAGFTEIPVQFGSLDANGNTRWSLPEAVPVVELTNLHFSDFFDWDPYGNLSMAYVRAKSAENGRAMLIEEMYCEFHILVAERA